MSALAPGAGWRGFRNRTLARVFELFDLARQVDKAQITVAAGDGGVGVKPLVQRQRTVAPG